MNTTIGHLKLLVGCVRYTVKDPGLSNTWCAVIGNVIDGSHLFGGALYNDLRINTVRVTIEPMKYWSINKLI